ncbi:hypothetical protein RJ640_002598, partial [Escallonia rubra]
MTRFVKKDHKYRFLSCPEMAKDVFADEAFDFVSLDGGCTTINMCSYKHNSTGRISSQILSSCEVGGGCTGEMRAHQAKLNCGIIIPNLGFGTYSFGNDRDTTELAIQMALKMGYMHFDTAKIYGSEPAVGTALREVILDGRVERNDIFVMSKLWGSDHHDPVSAVSTQANSK